MPEQALVTISTTRTDFGVFTLLTDPDQMEAYLQCPKAVADLTVGALTAFLREQEVDAELDREALSGIVELAAADKPVPTTRVAFGVQPEDGQDAKIEWHKKPTGMRLPSEADGSSDAVDYRELNAFANVKPGDHIATYHPAQEGQGGVDVFGKAIPARKVNELHVEPGENVRVDDGGTEFYATHYGHVEYRKHRIQVNPVYHVKGHVDLSQGNIRFIGRVEVDLDVKDDFEVTAEEGIFVGGTAEACCLKSAQDIVIRGGVTGKGKGEIEAQGNMEARFLDEVEVYAGGDVIVEKEIVNARVYAMGRVIVKAGTIISSDVVGLRGIQVQDAGSDLGVKTNLVAGLDYHVRNKLMGVNEELERVRTKQQTLLNRLGVLLTDVLKRPAVDNRVRQEIEDGMNTARGMQRQLERLEKESGDLMASFEDKAINCVSIARTLFAGVRITVGRYTWDNESILKGPLSIEADEREKRAQITQGMRTEALWRPGADTVESEAAD